MTVFPLTLTATFLLKHSTAFKFFGAQNEYRLQIMSTVCYTRPNPVVLVIGNEDVTL